MKKSIKKIYYLNFILILLFLQILIPISGLASENCQTTNQVTETVTYKKTRVGTWVYKANETYFINKKNKYVKKSWKTIEKKKYYFDKKGKMKTGWFTYKGYKYYLNKDGHMQTGWLTLKNKKYYFNKKGIMQTGFVRLSKKKYFFNKKTGVMKSGWLTTKGKTYYLQDDGHVHTGWLTLDGKKYYFNKNGIMQTGFVKLSKKTYYFNKKTGVMKSGWLTLKKKKYYFDKKGVMKTGWFTTTDNKKYYFNGNGVMQTGQVYIKNKGYVFRSDGTLDPNAKYTGINPNKKMVALTFDDGPSQYTMKLLNALEKYNAKATFFMVGQSVPRYQSAVKKMSKIGCELGNHTYDHPDLTRLSSSQIQSQISRTNSAIKAACGKTATVMRPPYGSYNSYVLSSLGMPAILWSVDTRDWATLNAYSTISHVKNNVRDGSVILFHDLYSPTVNAAIELIPWLQNQGYQLVTVSEMAKYRTSGLSAGKTYSSMYK